MATQSDRPLLGLPDMDTQHGYLYALFDRIEAAVALGKMKELLGEIERYLLFHFTSEEHLMRMYGFAGFAAHQADHELAGNKVVAFIDDFDNDRLNPAALRIFLTGWLMEHSISGDREYVALVQRRRAALFS